MVDTRSLLALTRSLEQETTNAATVERWLDRAKELQDELSWRVISLSRYWDELPQSSYQTYADALISALRDSDLEPRLGTIGGFRDSFQQFAKRLEDCGLGEKAELVRKTIDEELHDAK